jgi:TusA-related sulfurtransferase
MMEQREVLEAAARSFVDSVGARDFQRLAACFTGGARARLLLPYGLEECEGGEAVAGHVARWFGELESFELVESDTSVVSDRFCFEYRAHVCRSDDGGTRQVIAQRGFGDATPDGIEALDLVCSGFRPVASSTSPVELFDAGSMGCTDGLASEFKRRIQSVPSGGTLRVVVQDPAAKEDLPPLARMLGHHIQSIDTLQDGRVQIIVERAT